MQDINLIYNKALKLLDKYSSADATHRSDHTERVLKLIDYLVTKEKLERKIDLKSLKLAAILHDLGQSFQVKELKKSYDKLLSGNHTEYGLIIAQKFLKKEGFSNNQINKIKNIIASHGTHGQSHNLEGNILHDADLLDGIGLIGILRKFTYGGQIGRDILGSLEFTKLKIENRKFRTKTGQKLGNQRIKKVKVWIQHIENELESRNLV